MSQIQDKSCFFVNFFGDSKRIYDIERGFLVSLILPDFKSFFLSPCELQSLRSEGLIDYFKEQNYWNVSSTLAVLYSINNRRICAYMVPMPQIFVQAFFYVCFVP